MADQNLIKPTKLQQQRPPGFWKSIVLDLLSMLSALALGYFYFRYLTTGISPWYVLGAALVFSTCSVLQAFLARKPLRRTFVILGESIVLVVWFAFYDSLSIVLLAGGATFLILLWGYFSARADQDNNVEVAFFGTSRHVLGKLTTAILFVMIVVYVPSAQGSGVFIPRTSFKTFFDWSTSFLTNFYPSLPFNETFGTFSRGVAKSELQNNPTFNALSPSAQNAAIEQAAAQLSANVGAATGMAPAESQSLSDVVYNYIISTLAAWKDKFQDQFMAVWVLVVFLVLRTFAVAYIWIAQFVSLVIYEILLSLGFMHIGEETQTKEVVDY